MIMIMWVGYYNLLVYASSAGAGSRMTSDGWSSASVGTLARMVWKAESSISPWALILQQAKLGFFTW